jgi:putative aldouronate transport system permease protein
MAKIKKSTGSMLFDIFNYTFLFLVALACLVPLLNVLAISLSSQYAIATGRVWVWPVEFQTVAYTFLIKNKSFWRAMLVTLQRIALGGTINMLLAVLAAYPLSKDSKAFPARTRYAWYFLFTILFGGGLIPFFLTVKYTGLINTIWALVIPGAVPVFNVILLLNFFRQLPKEMEEAAFMDGAGHFRTLFSIFIPTSLPALATIGLFTLVGHWNEWFSGILLMKRTEKYPLQSYLQTIVIATNFKATSSAEIEILNKLSNRTISSAQIFIGMVPILSVYPFLQKYFTKGIVLGSVKG